MKKKIHLLLTMQIVVTMLLDGCTSDNDPGDESSTANPSVSNTSDEQNTDQSSEQAASTSDEPDDGSSTTNPSTDSTSSEQSTNENPAQTMSISEFENLLAEQPLYVSKTNYVIQDENLKSLYPDMLQAILFNNTTEDIKDAIVAFVAWDSNNLPVKIEGQIDFSGGSYIKKVNYSDINLTGGNTFGEDSGYSLGENCEIATFKAIVISFETFDGDTWDNPYYDAFCTLYEGEKYADDMTVEVEVVDSTFSASENAADSSVEEETSSSMTASELESNLSSQPITIIKTDYVVQDENLKTLYPDMLQAVLQNNTTDDIKNAVVAFVAWDSNNLPVKIEGQFDFGGGSYVKKVNYSDINLAAGDTFGENSGYSLGENCEIKSFKAIVVSYETFDGDTWDNPYYEDFCSLYEGKKLN